MTAPDPSQQLQLDAVLAAARLVKGSTAGDGNCQYAGVGQALGGVQLRQGRALNIGLKLRSQIAAVLRSAGPEHKPLQRLLSCCGADVPALAAMVEGVPATSADCARIVHCGAFRTHGLITSCPLLPASQFPASGAMSSHCELQLWCWSATSSQLVRDQPSTAGCFPVARRLPPRRPAYASLPVPGGGDLAGTACLLRCLILLL